MARQVRLSRRERRGRHHRARARADAGAGAGRGPARPGGAGGAGRIQWVPILVAQRQRLDGDKENHTGPNQHQVPDPHPCHATLLVATPINTRAAIATKAYAVSTTDGLNPVMGTRASELKEGTTGSCAACLKSNAD